MSPLRIIPRPAVVVALLAVAAPVVAPRALRAADGEPYASAWDHVGERAWIGPDFWANRLQDWSVREGRVELAAHASTLPLRTLHLLTRRLSPRRERFEASIELGPLETAQPATAEAAGGLLLGAGRGLDHRAASLVFSSGGPGAGIFVGATAGGALVVRDMEVIEGGVPRALARLERAPATARDTTRLVVRAEPDADGESFVLHIFESAQDATSALSVRVPAARLGGNVAIACEPGRTTPANAGRGRWWFRDLRLSGAKVDAHPERALGPIISTQYTLTDGVLRLTAQLFPTGAMDAREVVLETRQGDAWVPVASAPVRQDSCTATFRIADWAAVRDVGFRVVHELRGPDGDAEPHSYEGTIRRDPVDRDTIVVAAFTGNHNTHWTIGNPRFDWLTGVWFPHQDIVDHVAAIDPDLLFYSGDQIYEGRSPSPVDRAHLRLDYLYKWYLWCWAHGPLARSRPCITIPDDHDVYQGNLWGQGGRATDKDDKGGYVHPASFVRMVEHTQTDHLPDPWDPRPIDQDIGVYYTAMRWGGIGFAILEDRKFKSGCAGRVPGLTRGRPDHIVDPEFDVSLADVPGTTLLGERQLRFLDHWTADWRGQEMKVALSQTVFANLATHHGGELFRLIADLDSNGWPQSGRRRALEALRRGFVFHLAGDQHLATVVHHGIDEPGDAAWSFCVPSIANFYPRAWMPETAGEDRRPGEAEHLGRHRDGFGNLVDVRAVTNPWHASGKTGVPKTGREPADLHDRMPGFGIVRLDKASRKITMECWPRYAKPGSDDQYPGWPITVDQTDNFGRAPSAWLPRLVIENEDEAVLHVVSEDTGRTVYSLRLPGREFRPPVFAAGTYRIVVEDPEDARVRILPGVPASTEEVPDVHIRLPDAAR